MRFSVRLCLVGVLWLCNLLPVAAQQAGAKSLEADIAKALASATRCKNSIVRLTPKAGKPKEIERLAIKLDGVPLGQLVADYVTVVLDGPVVDWNKLQTEKQLVFVSQGRSKVSIFASPASLEDYLQRKARQFNKKNVHISVKFTPPHIECTYDVPKDEIASESVDLLKKFIKGDKIEGYAAFQFDVKDNGLNAYSSKVITNHFLLPNGLLRTFQSKFNPFDQIVVLKPFQYTINNLTVQSKYLYMTN